MLKSKELILSDFKSFRGEHKIGLDLAPGLYFMTGINLVHPEKGANATGKTTLWDAWYWCLTGDTLKADKPADEIVPWTGGKKTFARYSFELDGTAHTLHRSRKPNKLLLDDKPVEQPAIYDLLGISAAALKRSIIVGQFSTLFLDMEPREQTALFNEALSLDLWLEAAAVATTTARTIADNIAELKRQVDRADGEYSATYDQWERVKTEATTFDIAHANDTAVKLAAFHDAEVALQDARALAFVARPAHRDTKDTERDAVASRLVRSQAALKPIETKNAVDTATLRTVTADLARYAGTEESRMCPECGSKVPLKHITEKKRGLISQEADLITAVRESNEEISQRNDVISILKAELEEHDRTAQAAQETERQIEREHHEARAALAGAEATMEVAKTAWIVERDRTNTFANQATNLSNRLNNMHLEQGALETKLTATQAEEERYTNLAAHFKELRLKLIDDILLELETMSNQYSGQLGIPKCSLHFATERETKAGTVAQGFTTWITVPERDKPIRWEMFSGGEAQRLNLATTFGLSDVLLGRAGLQSNIEVLDEPTTHLSPEGIESLLDHLADRAASEGKAIIVIDHSSLNRGAFIKTMTVVHDENGSRLVT